MVAVLNIDMAYNANDDHHHAIRGYMYQCVRYGYGRVFMAKRLFSASVHVVHMLMVHGATKKDILACARMSFRWHV